jgi:hypothetical protein
MMFPFAIPGITSLASSALHTWNRIAESKAAEKAQPPLDFQALLNTVAGAGSTSGSGEGGLQQGMAALPEVRGALAAAGSGTQVQFTVSPDGSLSRMLPGGGPQDIPLSAESQALFRQWNTANPGASLSVGLVG